MIYPATQEISNYFTMQDIKHRIDETDTASFVEAGFNGKVVKGLIVRYFSSSERNDVAVRVANFGGGSVPDDRKDEILVLLNTLNCQFRFAKFCLTPAGTISVEFDLPQNTAFDALGETAREIFIRLIQICDSAYPQVMKVLWG